MKMLATNTGKSKVKPIRKERQQRGVTALTLGDAVREKTLSLDTKRHEEISRPPKVDEINQLGRGCILL